MSSSFNKYGTRENPPGFKESERLRKECQKRDGVPKKYRG